MILGVAFLVVVVGLAQLLVPPPKGYVPAASGANSQKGSGTAVKREDFRPTEMLATGQFYLCWLLYAIGAGAGLMIISQLATTVAKQANLLESGFWLVVSCGVGNGAGRILAGMLSDKLGRQRTLQGCFIFQAVVLMLLSVALPNTSVGKPARDAPSVSAGGSELRRQPGHLPFDHQGLLRAEELRRELRAGLHRWGFGGFMLAQGASKIYDKLGVFTYNYYGAASLLVFAAIVAFALKPPHVLHEPAAAD